MSAPSAPAWPSYDIGSHDSVFALGVASVNYARLEFAFGHVFAKVLEISNNEAWKLLPTLSNFKRLRRMRDGLQRLNWPADTKDRVARYMMAFKILTGNRNLLDHSNVFGCIETPTSLYKYDRRTGKTIHTVVTLVELRQVADEMRVYYDYGLCFGNALGPDGAVGPPFTRWPSQPPLPQKLNYTTEPLSLNKGK